MNLFQGNYEDVKPLALKMRPKNLDEFIGQEKILGKGKVLRKLIESKKISNMIFYGPPGVGKTTLGEIISRELDYNFESLNATTDGVSAIKDVVTRARENLEYYGKKTILFLDEIHRFNKLQQDSLLSSTEAGYIVLIGATTENPYYNLNNALLSRVLLFEFTLLSDDDIRKMINRASTLSLVTIPDKILDSIISMSSGDGRVALNYFDLYLKVGEGLDESDIISLFQERGKSFHKEEDKYNLISAMIKSIRGSDPDSSIYWMSRLLIGGEDPRFIARRLVILAAEDIGMANPESLLIANAAMDASERIGMPEIRIVLAQAVIYLAISSKSNASYEAVNSAFHDINSGDLEEVPINIRHNNVGYLYPHDYSEAFVKQEYSSRKGKYYKPKNSKNEKLIKEKISNLWGKIYK